MIAARVARRARGVRRRGAVVPSRRTPARFAAAMAEIAGIAGAARAARRARGRRARRRFSWAASARAHLAAYSLALEQMKIAILGTRGIPASYSGFETAVEQLASRLTDARTRGDRLLPPARRRPEAEDATRARELVHLRTVQNKYLDTFVHTALSAIHAARVTKPDVALFFIAGNSPLCLITRWASIPAVINVDGLDSDRAQVAGVRQGVPPLRRADRTAVGRRGDHRQPRGRRHLRAPLRPADRRGPVRRRGSRATTAPRRSSGSGSSRASYILFVGRLEPENNPHLLVEAFSPDRRRRRRAG